MLAERPGQTWSSVAVFLPDVANPVRAPKALCAQFHKYEWQSRASCEIVTLSVHVRCAPHGVRMGERRHLPDNVHAPSGASVKQHTTPCGVCEEQELRGAKHREASGYVRRCSSIDVVLVHWLPWQPHCIITPCLMRIQPNSRDTLLVFHYICWHHEARCVLPDAVLYCDGRPLFSMWILDTRWSIRSTLSPMPPLTTQQIRMDP